MKLFAFRPVLFAAASLLGGFCGTPLGASFREGVLEIPAVSLVDAYPGFRSLQVSIVQGSVTASDGGVVGLGAVHLPSGAEIRALSIHGVDGNADEDVEVRIFRRIISTAHAVGEEMALAETSGSSGALQSPRDATIASPVIDNERYLYWVAARIHADTALHGIRLEYLSPLFRDGFEAGGTAAWASGATEPGFTSPLTVHFADVTTTDFENNGCWLLGDTGSTAEAYLGGGSSTGYGCCFVAPVHLPDGVEVTAMASWVRDAGAADLTLSLRRKRVSNTFPSSALATNTTSGSSNSVRPFLDGTIVDGVIDNSQYSYFLASDTCLDSEHELEFYQAQIFFSE